MMAETDPSDHNPVCHNEQLGPEFPEVARCWCEAERGQGKGSGAQPLRGTFPKLEIALPQGYPQPGAGA